jgi:putative tricarboxylic transport membrane protein
MACWASRCAGTGSRCYLIIGLILAPRAEGQLRKSLQLSAGDISGLWSEPIAVGVYVVVALILAWPLVALAWRRYRPAKETVPETAALAEPAPEATPERHPHQSRL